MAIFSGGTTSNIISSITTAVKSTYNKAKDTASSGYETIIRYKDNFFSHLNSELSKVKDYFGQGYEKISSSMSDAWGKATDIEKPSGIFESGITRAQNMANIAMDKVEDLTIPDLVKALTNWTVGFVLGIIQGFFNAINYGLEKGLSPVKGALHAIAAGMYEGIIQVGNRAIGFFDSIWSGASNIIDLFGPFAPVFAYLVVVFAVIVIYWAARTIPPWLTERGYELL